MEEEKYIKEKELSSLPKSISAKKMKILLNLLETNICKIYCNDGSRGTGFFCNIEIGWNKNMKVLMTNNHVLNANAIKPGKTVKFSINNDNKYYNILIDKSRKAYTNESYDVTIIEIKEKDKINEKSFFDLDRQIFEENSDEIFRNTQIYLLHYPKGIEMETSNGVIKSISIDNQEIQHLCDTSGGSSGSPIINKDNFKVIGIHKGGAEGAKNYNLGTLLKGPIEQFKQEIEKKEKKIDNNNTNLKGPIEQNKQVIEKKEKKIDNNNTNVNHFLII
jgi:hypothetical protein